jgi:hypothetical protein
MIGEDAKVFELGDAHYFLPAILAFVLVPQKLNLILRKKVQVRNSASRLRPVLFSQPNHGQKFRKNRFVP